MLGKEVEREIFVDENKDKIVFSTDTYTNKLINEIMRSGEFNSVSSMIRAAIQFFAYHSLTLKKRPIDYYGKQSPYDTPIRPTPPHSNLHPKDRKVQEEIDAEIARPEATGQVHNGDRIIVDRGTGEVRKVEKG